MIKKFERQSDLLRSAAIAPDGKTALSGGYDNMLRLWDLATGRLIKTFEGHSGWVSAVAIAPDGKTALSGSIDRTLRLWDLVSGREIRKFEGHSDSVNSVAFAPDGKSALSGSNDKTLKLWDLATGREVREFRGHSAAVRSVAISPDGKTVLSGSGDGSTRVWDLERGEERAALFASPFGKGEAPEGQWFALTPKGFFAASRRDMDMLAIVRGFEVTTIGQVHQSLFNPDLVREALAGDPDGEVKRAAEFINLDKVIDGGPAPLVEITSPTSDRKSDTDLVTVAARIEDRGKGIGRIEWRVNGITVGVSNAPTGVGLDYKVKQTVALDSGENVIEVVAYNARNLLASLPAQTTITYAGPIDAVKPKLYVLAIGINAYHDDGWIPPGETDVESFPPLDLAVADAEGVAAELKKAADGLYSEVHIRTVLDAEANAAGLDRIVDEISAEVSPRDTFVLFATGHGYSIDGHFYLLPQDYQGGANPAALMSRAISQQHLQAWLAGIKAKKAVILLDTCESGALTRGYAHSRIDAAASETAVGRLHEATGRPVLTAAAEGKSAYEDYKGHGVFSYALMEALHLGDANNNGKIELTELAAYVERRVPEFFAELKQNGWVVKGATAAGMRGGQGD